jgi:hypothetical protein
MQRLYKHMYSMQMFQRKIKNFKLLLLTVTTEKGNSDLTPLPIDKSIVPTWLSNLSLPFSSRPQPFHLLSCWSSGLTSFLGSLFRCSGGNLFFLFLGSTGD